MLSIVLTLLVTLLVILVAAETFTNALEHMGERLGISQGVTGSLFAAIATALPETMVPLLALLAGTSDRHLNESIGTGAILGAPLMLSTLSTALMALSVIGKRGWNGAVTPERGGMLRDLNGFILVYGLAAATLFLPSDWQAVRALASMILIVSYFLYVMMTLKASAQLVEQGHGTEAEEPLLLSRLGFPEGGAMTILQLIVALILLLGGAKGFIHGIEQASHHFGVSPLLLSLLIIPIATELPEKINSILWLRRGQDTLAFGNITGAMVFQGSLLPAIGISLTSWRPSREVVLGVAVTLLAACWVRLCADKGLKVWSLAMNGILYAAYLVAVLW